MEPAIFYLVPSGLILSGIMSFGGARQGMSGLQWPDRFSLLVVACNLTFLEMFQSLIM